MPLGNLGRGIKDALVGTIKGAGDVVGTTTSPTPQSGEAPEFSARPVR